MATHAAEKRPLGAIGRMGVVAAMHAALVFVIANSLGLMPKSKEPPEIITTVSNEPQQIERPEPIEYHWQPEETRLTLPEPEVPPVATDDTERVIDASLSRPDQLPESAGSSDPVPQIPQVGVRLDPRHPLTQPPYPPWRIRTGSEGVVDLEVYVQPNGRVGDARIVKSSGFDDFDRVTLDEARRSWRLSPATRDGQPFAQWYRLRVVFKLKNQQ